MKPLGLIVAVGLQVAYLGGQVAFHQARSAAGTLVVLRTAPVDPSSIFRGRYAALTYEISRLPASLLGDVETKQLSSGEPVYVSLSPGASPDAPWKAVAVSRGRPSGGTWITGHVDRASHDEVWVRYGIEHFFLSEAGADALEARQSRGPRPWEWRSEEKRKRLSAEEQRIDEHLRPWWDEALDIERAMWVREGLITQPQSDALADKYRQARARIAAAEQAVQRAEEEARTQVEVIVSVTPDGRGYPKKLVWGDVVYK